MARKLILNNDIFISEAEKIYGSRFDYSLIDCVSKKTDKVPVVCPKHGVFYTTYNRFIVEQKGCPKCAAENPVKWDTDSVIKKIKEIHGDKYDTSKVIYNGYKTKMTLVCPVHGEFQIDLSHILRRQGCPKCRYVKASKTNARTLYSVLLSAKEVHNNKYDYSLINEYTNDRVKYPIICPEHGIFYQTMNNHIKGKQGCPVCGREKCNENRKITFSEFVKRAREKHGDYYQYNENSYNGISKYVSIICPKHGKFQQTGSNHLLGQGCPICGNLSGGMKLRLSQSEFIEKAKQVHGDKYDYSKVEYVNNNTKVCIICPKHGEFWQLPYNHLQGNGCPKCVPLYSHEEEELFSFIKNDLSFEEVIKRDRNILNGKELDIFIPNKNIAIEFDGLFWHSEFIKPNKNSLLDKTELCRNNNIRLIHIFEDEWNEKREIVKSMIRNILHKTENKIYARKCKIKEVDSTNALDFLQKNHIQGKCHSTVKIGLYYNDELVSLMCFGSTRHFIGNNKNGWELLRFCNKINTNVIGGASKLFKYFIDNYNPNEIISYADKRISIGTLYDVLGFEKYNESKPNYYYVIGNKRIYRFNLRKSILVKKYGCPENMSEHEFCLSKKWYRIYDCGCLCYRWKK